ncbi:regulatory protein, partial [Saccharothrix sp. ST-888]
MAVREPYGVWRGLTEGGRGKLMRRSRNRLAEVRLGLPTAA